MSGNKTFENVIAFKNNTSLGSGFMRYVFGTFKTSSGKIVYADNTNASSSDYTAKIEIVGYSVNTSINVWYAKY